MDNVVIASIFNVHIHQEFYSPVCLQRQLGMPDLSLGILVIKLGPPLTSKQIRFEDKEMHWNLIVKICS